MGETYNCPNCGAPIESEVCPFCGTIIYDFVNLQIGKPCYIRAKFGNRLITFNAVPEAIQPTVVDNPVSVYGDDKIVETMHADLCLAPSDQIALYKVYPNAERSSTIAKFVHSEGD